MPRPWQAPKTVDMITFDVPSGPVGALGPNARIRFNGRALARVVAESTRDFLTGTVGQGTVFVAKAVKGAEFRNDRLTWAETMAAAGRAGALAGYMAHHSEASRVGPGPYRIGSSRLSTHLERAIRESNFVDASPSSFAYANRRVLNREAAHWQRLHFGAGVAGQTTEPAKEVKLKLAKGGRMGGQATNRTWSLSIAGGPRPGFAMPMGWWSGSRPGKVTGFRKMDPQGPLARTSTEAFLPTGRNAEYKMTRGIVGSRFLDEGLIYIRDKFPEATADLGEDFTDVIRRDFESGARQYNAVKIRVT